jgi:hypothetical protein
MKVLTPLFRRTVVIIPLLSNPSFVTGAGAGDYQEPHHTVTSAPPNSTMCTLMHNLQPRSTLKKAFRDWRQLDHSHYLSPPPSTRDASHIYRTHPWLLHAGLGYPS